MTQSPYGPNYPANTPSYPPVPPVPPAPYTSPTPPPPPAYAMSATPAYGAPVAQKKSPVLGLVGLLIVLVCAVIFFIGSLNFYNAIYDVMGPDFFASGNSALDYNTLSPAAQAALTGPLAIIGLSSLVGIVGFVLSIVGTAQNKGRPFGIIGIILGILAPFGFLLAAGVSMSAHGSI